MKIVGRAIEFGAQDVILCDFETDRGAVSICAQARLARRRMVLAQTHIDGPGANQIGLAGLRALARIAMEELDVDEIVIEGAKRTTGAAPGRVPSPLRFRR
jgi:hypothetical protein